MKASGLLFRYIIALGLIAAFITSAYSLSAFSRAQGVENAKIINISGRQRMLSQRIAHFAYLYENTSPDQADLRRQYEERLTSAVNLFEKSHQALVYGDNDIGISNLAGTVAQQIYFNEPEDVHSKTIHYIRAARFILNDAPEEAAQEQLNIILDMAANDLLKGLDDVVHAIEDYDHKLRDQLEQMETLFFILALGLLCIEAALIFWPSYVEIKRALKEKTILEDTQRALHSAHEELENFAYRTSHDLKSPLISAATLLNMAENHLMMNKTHEAEKAISTSKHELMRLGQLVENILTMIRTQFKAQEPQPIILPALIDHALNNLSHLKHNSTVEIETDFQHKHMLVLRADRLLVILENLISNAYKFADLNKTKSYIKIATYDEGNATIIDVIDNGIGIDADEEDKLFIMFNRLQSSRTHDGAGLGLYMAKKCADLLGAKITHLQQGDETIFRVKMPMQKLNYEKLIA